jgi:hypothetical protein
MFMWFYIFNFCLTERGRIWIHFTFIEALAIACVFPLAEVGRVAETAIHFDVGIFTFTQFFGGASKFWNRSILQWSFLIVAWWLLQWLTSWTLRKSLAASGSEALENVWTTKWRFCLLFCFWEESLPSLLSHPPLYFAPTGCHLEVHAVLELNVNKWLTWKMVYELVKQICSLWANKYHS